VPGLFQTGTRQLAYSHEDRMILLGAVPVQPPNLSDDTKPLTGTDFLLQRRELGLINIGGPGRVTADGLAHDIDTEEALYLGAGTGNVIFESLTETPARFYGNSAPPS
jgi:4-deoxy-L-threo-5-hexosulose-uronate ketol-isomerase